MTTTPTKKNLKMATAIGATALLALTACAPATSDTSSGADSTDLTIGVFNGWPEGEAVSILWKTILEEKGYTVELEYADVLPVFSALSTGDYDVTLDGWLPTTHKSLMDEYGDDLGDLGAWNDEAVLTVAVNEDAPIDSLDELSAESELFDNRIVGIEPGAGLTEAVSEETIPTYGLDSLDFQTSSTPAMLGELKAALAAGENIAVTLWRPHWAYDAFPLKDLEDPEGTLGDKESLHTLARDDFEGDHPKVAGWFSGFTMSSELLYSLENVMYNEYDGTDFDPIVEKWIVDNQEYVDGLTS